MEQKEYVVTVFGQKHSIVSDESEQNLLLIAKEVNNLFSSLISQANSFTDKQLTVLVALQLASKMIASQKQCQDYDTAILDIITLIDTLICTNGSAE